MAIFSIDHISIKAIAAAVPKNTIDNTTYPYHSPRENEQFIKTTGIKYRRIVKDNTTASELCAKCANAILDDKNINKDEINILIFISQTPDYTIPCTATILQEKLGLSKSCMAFDINLGCSGYVYGLSVVASLLQHVKGKALLLVGDTSSKIIHEKDKATAPLFSDAGSATLLEYTKNTSPIHFNLQSDGSGYSAIIRKDGGLVNPFTEKSLVFDEEKASRPIDMTLDGIRVFNFSRREVIPNIKALLSHFEIAQNTIAYYIFHQANQLMNRSLMKKLSITEEQTPSTLENYGNTSSASIPVTLCVALADKNLREQRILLSGFGVGLSWGSALVSLSHCSIYELLEIEETN